MLKRILSAIVLSVFTLTACSAASADTQQTTTEQTTIQNNVQNTAVQGAPYLNHGALSVKEGNLIDSKGDPYQLYGMSTHGLAWFPQYVNLESFKTLRDDWNTNCVRLALYTDEYDGYCNGGNKENLKNLVKNGIDYTTQLGMYVIVDWHILNDKDPNVYKAEALKFFNEISSEYKNNDNIIYEICNEPNTTATWESITAYANEVIPVIRANDSNAVILVGTPFWSQEIDKPLNKPLAYDNIMYVLHFYADTHRDDLRQRLVECKEKKLPVFISEFGMCDSSGNGNNNFDEMTKWKAIIDKYNLSYMCWNLSNKAETCAVISSSCSKTSAWSENDLSQSGKWIRNIFKAET